MSTIIAIDFGTSNSAVGFLKEGNPRLVELEDNKTSVPSAVFYDTAEEQTLFGNEAISYYIDGHEGRLLRSLKSILGGRLIEGSTAVGNKNVKFKDIVEEFIGHLKKQAEKSTGQYADSVVMGRPVKFVDADERADAAAQASLEEIAKKAGFKNIAFQYEPIAAALDYEQSVAHEEVALIVDIGGGTSDFSVVRVSPDRCGKEDRKDDILANTGVRVGGTDFDTKLSLGQVMPLFGYGSKTRPLFSGEKILELPSFYFHELATWHRINFLYNNKTLLSIGDIRYRAERQDLLDRFVKIIKNQEGHRLAGDVEAAKIILSEKEVASILLEYVEHGLQEPVYRQAFEDSIRQEKNKIILNVRECIKQSGLAPSSINTVFFTGGSTAIPAIARACKDEVPEAKVIEGNRFGSVALGLAIDSGVKFGGGRRPSLFNAPSLVTPTPR
ncbi:MAG: Hsp70 family protein [Alphaproteobacteria bacterium]|nr:Hsp70 family protein [Alphaproteobacteria bacterium]